ncbi:DUF4168 domain-containing protein [Gloeothece verrucosa]|uniref:DUF4168 domain-containing protein n=1 Tax=Gloeothece verrucosa (strain PCC 7822) TaxID=497965 RepID=E0U7E7_GLOV7|nr:DUF4168 domain-containing protein [Gloeothece verrucosa]ADN13643.1 conserved hypothetical protein [Gloeothece verrucosa PCC 7822]
MLINHCSLFNLNRNFIRSLIASLLAAMSFSCEGLPNFHNQPSPLTPSSSAYTQDFNEEQINQYARAVLKIETRRIQAYKEFQSLTGNSPPQITCNQPETLKSLPEPPKKIAIDYCLKAKEIAEESGLNNEQFNTITVRLKTDQDLKRRIQNAMIRIQREQQQ